MRILLVEDDRRLANYLRKGLSEESYSVDIAADGPGALGSIERLEYDVIVLDVLLPGKDGMAVCRSGRLSTQAFLLRRAAGQNPGSLATCPEL